MIMISNNAWFTPSIEPTLQHLLFKILLKKYSVTIFHVVNGSENRIYKVVNRIAVLSLLLICFCNKYKTY